MPAGHARALLLDVLRRATTRGGWGGGGGAVRAEQLGPLIVAACTAAQDLAALEQHLTAFDEQRDRLAGASTAWLDALGRCERGRDLLTQRLLDASAALSGWQAHALTSAEGGSGTLAELALNLDEEGRRQAEAAREVADLLA